MSGGELIVLLAATVALAVVTWLYAREQQARKRGDDLADALRSPVKRRPRDQVLGQTGRMRDLTPEEWKYLADGHCPYCEGDKFYEGPSGGMAMNIQCATPECGAKFNHCGFVAQLIEGPRT